jgi:hypothetical protein
MSLAGIDDIEREDIVFLDASPEGGSPEDHQAISDQSRSMNHDEFLAWLDECTVEEVERIVLGLESTHREITNQLNGISMREKYAGDVFGYERWKESAYGARNLCLYRTKLAKLHLKSSLSRPEPVPELDALILDIHRAWSLRSPDDASFTLDWSVARRLTAYANTIKGRGRASA